MKYEDYFGHHVKSIGRFTITDSLFDDGDKWVDRDGVPYGTIHADGTLTILKGQKFGGCYISRAMAWKYWVKYLPDVNRYNLPKALQEALDEPTVSWGVYYSKKFKCEVGFEG